MKRGFFAIALLATSWLPGVGYFHLPDPLACATMVIAGVLLLMGTRDWEMDRRTATASAILCAIAVMWVPWPYRAIPLLLAIGLAMSALPIPTGCPRRIGSAAISAGVILLGQALVVFVYTQLTARSHELPEVLAQLVTAIARLIGIPAAYDGQNISLATMRINHPMAATWELFVDPATLCFLIGGLVWIGRRNWRGDLAYIACVLLWIPARIALLLGLFMHRAIRTDYDAPILLMDQYWNTWTHLLMLFGPAMLACALAPLSCAPLMEGSDLPSTKRNVIAALLACAAGVLVALAIYWDPVGQRQPGRIVFDEVHRVDRPDSNFHGWEPTDTNFDVDSYGHNAAYTYSVLYNYLAHFYDVSRQTGKIDDQSLSTCDVYILKVPTAGFESSEITALTHFVARGGGLLLIGEHTDVFGTGTYLNQVATKFGFRFRYDCLFDIDEVFQQRYRRDLVAHPIVQNLPELDFAVSCSIEVPLSLDRAAIVSTGLRSLPADYHASNFYPQVEHVDRAETRYGSFVQLWSQRHVNGRVVAFSDSTQFSNFCLFDPGKSELFMGMTEWLNHRTTRDDPRLPLAGIGAIAMIAAWSAARRWTPSMLLALSAAIFGWSISLPVLGAMQRHAMPLPRPVRPLTRVVMDRTVCDSTLPLAGFIAGKPDGYGIFERWILRLGYFTTRRSGIDALHDNLVVFTNPDKPVSPEFRDAVERYVTDGGKILVIDSAENQSSTANSLLAPYNIHFKREAALSGDLNMSTTISTTLPTTQPATTTSSAIAITNAVEVAVDDATSADTLAKVSDKPVSMMLHHGKGSVTVVGYGTRFSDLNMGFTGDNEPDAGLRAVYQVEFDLLKKIVEGR